MNVKGMLSRHSLDILYVGLYIFWSGIFSFDLISGTDRRIMDKRELVYLYKSLFNVFKITFKSINEELSALTFSNNRGL